MTKQISIVKRAIFLMALFIFSSCEKPNEGLGFDSLIGEIPGVGRAEFPITTQTRIQDSILVAINYDAQLQLAQGYLQPKLLGTYVDPLFGLSKAEFISEMLLEDLNPQFGSAPIIDSVNLYLRTTDYYGDTTRPINLTVHQLSESLSRDSAFYSSFSPALGLKLGELTSFTPKPNARFKFKGEAVLPSFKIPLDKGFFKQQILDQGNAFDAFTTNEKFRTYFKGIKVSVEAGEGSILTLNTNSVNSKILIFFRTEDTATTSSQIELNFAQNKTTKPIGFSTFKQDYVNYPVAFDTTDTDSEALYVQPMGGVFGALDFEMLDTLQEKGYAINRAYLELPIKRTTTRGLLAATALEVRELDETKQIGPLSEDFRRSQGGGTLLLGELRDNQYRLEFTRALFKLLNNVESGTPLPTFAIVPVNKSTSARRTVLNGGNNTFEAPRLVVFYTKPK